VPTDGFHWCAQFVFRIEGKKTRVLSTGLTVIDRTIFRILSPMRRVLAELYAKAPHVDNMGL
jgi:hypothetical protein